MRVKINSDGSYVYPDVVATCLPPEFEDDVLDTLTNPQLIIEVLSDSTESYDRGKKFERYRAIETMTNYILIAQDRVSVEHFVRNENQVWELHPATCSQTPSISNLWTVVFRWRMFTTKSSWTSRTIND